MSSEQTCDVQPHLDKLHEDHCKFNHYLREHGNGVISSNQYRFSPLHVAVYCKCIRAVVQFMPKYVNEQDNAGYTALHAAIQLDFIEAIDLILTSSTINLSLEDGNGFNVFHLAATRGKPDLMKSLLKVAPHLVDVQKDNGRSPLHFAALYGFKSVTEVLLTEGKANVNLTDINDNTALMYASREGFVDTVETLVKNNADVNLQDDEGKTALLWAIMEDKTSVAELLIQCPTIDLSVRDNKDFTVLHVATLRENEAVIRKLIAADNKLVNVKRPDGFTPLHVAASFGKNSAAEILLSEGNADPNSVSIHNVTPLMLAVHRNFPDIVKTLLKFKPEVNCQDLRGVTALHLTAMLGLPTLFQCLTECPTLDLGLLNFYNRQNALHLAIRAGHEFIAERLIELGPELVDVLDKDSRSPLHYAVAERQPAIVEFLVKRGASLEVADVKGDTPLHYLLQCRLLEPDSFWNLNPDTSPEISKIMEEGEDVMYAQTGITKGEKNMPINIEDVAVAAFLVLNGADLTQNNNQGESFATLAGTEWAQKVETLKTRISESREKHFYLMLEKKLKLLPT